jgi:hypothetical protein
MNRIKNLNRTFHLLQKADILTCYEHSSSRSLSTDNRNVPLFKTIEMSPFVVVVHF